MNYRDIITIEPGKRSGKPCIRGLRITFYDVLEYLASGMSEAEILEDFPELTREDIRGCLAFAADRERWLSVMPAEWQCCCSIKTCPTSYVERWRESSPVAGMSARPDYRTRMTPMFGTLPPQTASWLFRRIRISVSGPCCGGRAEMHLAKAWQLTPLDLLLVERQAVALRVAQHAAEPQRRRSAHKALQILNHLLDVAHFRAFHREDAPTVDEVGEAQREHHRAAGRRRSRPDRGSSGWCL